MNSSIRSPQGQASPSESHILPQHSSMLHNTPHGYLHSSSKATARTGFGPSNDLPSMSSSLFSRGIPSHPMYAYHAYNVSRTDTVPYPAGLSPQTQYQSQRDALGTARGDLPSKKPVQVTPLRRGQACQACRRRKLKCDAARPVCGTCVKSRKAAALANHISPVPEGDCIYDEVMPHFSSQGHNRSISRSRTPSSPVPEEHERVTFKRAKIRRDEIPHPETPEQRAERLEARVKELEDRLRQASEYTEGKPRVETGTTPWRFRSRATSREPEHEFRPAVPIMSMLSPLSGREERHRMHYFQRPARYNGPDAGHNEHAEGKSTSHGTSSLRDVILPTKQTDATEKGKTDLDQQEEPVPTAELPSVEEIVTNNDHFMQLLWPGWSNDLPSADTVNALCETFFRFHSLRNIVYKPAFMMGLFLPPDHPHRPDDSLVHAVLAAAADISPFHEVQSTLGIRDRFAVFLADPFSRPNTQQSQSADVLTFKEFHLSKARMKVEQSLMTDFKNPLDWLASCLISTFVLWDDGRFVESYFLSGFVCRAVAPAGLDKLPSRHYSIDGSVKHAPGIFGVPQGFGEHERRNILWHAFIADQYTSGPPGFYENMLSEAAIQTHLPCKQTDFRAGRDTPPNNQTLSSSDLFTTGHTDDFTLHIKSAVLLRRASTLSARTQRVRTKPSGVSVIDRHIDEFLENFPSLSLDTASSDALNAYSNVSLALIYLHEPFLNPTILCTLEYSEKIGHASANRRILMAVDRVLTSVHQLMNSSFDFALLHPQVFLTWSVVGRMMGKDTSILQKRLHRGDSEDNDKWGMEQTSADSLALEKVQENLSLIVSALRRGGSKSLKARRCSELVDAVRLGHVHESYLSHLLYLDGVIPTGEEENGSQPTAMQLFQPSFLPSQDIMNLMTTNEMQTFEDPALGTSINYMGSADNPDLMTEGEQALTEIGITSFDVFENMVDMDNKTPHVKDEEP